MADAIGDITRGFPFLAIKGLTKTNTAITLGKLVVYDTDGWGPSAATDAGPFGVALNTQAAVVSEQLEADVFLTGAIRISKKTGTGIAQGQGVMQSADAGDATVWAVADVGGTPDQTSINAALLDVTQKIGVCLTDAASGATMVETLMP